MKHVISVNMSENAKVLMFDDTTNTAEWIELKTIDNKNKWDFKTQEVK